MIKMDKDYLNKLFIDEVKGGMNRGGGGGAQPDWNADPDQPGHILNRTHWKEEGKTILEPTAVEFVDGMGVIDCFLDLEVGKTYTLKLSIADLSRSMEYTGVAETFTEGDMDLGVAVPIGGYGSEYMIATVYPEYVELIGAKTVIFCGVSDATIQVTIDQLEYKHPIDEYLSIPLIPTFNLHEWGVDLILPDASGYQKITIDDTMFVTKMRDALTQGPVFVTAKFYVSGGTVSAILHNTPESATDMHWHGVWNSGNDYYNYYIQLTSRQFVCELYYDHNVEDRVSKISLTATTLSESGSIISTLTDANSEHYLGTFTVQYGDSTDCAYAIKDAFSTANPSAIEIKELCSYDGAKKYIKCRLDMVGADEYAFIYTYSGIFVDSDMAVYCITLTAKRISSSDTDAYYTFSARRLNTDAASS